MRTWLTDSVKSHLESHLFSNSGDNSQLPISHQCAPSFPASSAELPWHLAVDAFPPWTGFGSLTPGSPPGLKNSLVTHLKPFPSLSLTTCVPRVSVSAGRTPPPFQTPRLKTSVTSPLPCNTQLAVHFKFTSFFFEMSMVSIPSSPIPPLPPLTRPRLVYPASWLSYGTPSSPLLPTYS